LRNQPATLSERSYHIVYVGPLAYGQTCRQRLEALKALGHHVWGVDTMPPEVERRRGALAERLGRKIWGPRDLGQINERVLRRVEEHRPEILWIDKGLIIDPRTLLRAKEISPQTVTVSYSPDDMMNPDNQSPQYLKGVGLYDLHVTTKSYNVAELRGLGARAVLFVNNAYCPITHRPWRLTSEERSRLGGPVGFIGTYEPPRADLLLWLARQGIPVKVWGSWPKGLGKGLTNLTIMGAPLWGKEYAKGIGAFDINLAFLNKKNRDLQTTRTMEIPACGAFMLAERTSEHLALFQEGQEAEFFASPAELLAKIRYYLDHGEERQRIAAAGLARCQRSGYSTHATMARILTNIAKHHFCKQPREEVVRGNFRQCLSNEHLR
jgi:spore maturation protein CgeB